MPKTLRFGDSSYMRRLDVQNLLEYLYNLQCVQMVGFSNVGKSALLRLLAQPDVWTQELGEAGQEFLVVYVDCNRMLEMSDQGFYELVLRCLQESSPELASLQALSDAYEMLVAPASEFQIPLGFNRGLTAALQHTPAKVALLLDEFDEPFEQIDSRVFLNLRALRDRFSSNLVYVTATGKPLHKQRDGQHAAEFVELFAKQMWFLAPLTRPDVERLVHRYVQAYEVEFIAADLDLIHEWAGGHPNLVEGVCTLLDRCLDASNTALSEPTARWEVHQRVMRTLRSDDHLTSECAKIWRGCSDEEQEELVGLYAADHEPDTTVLMRLARRHLVKQVEGRYQPFCRLFAEFVRRKAMERHASASLWVDTESGDVLVNGEPIEPLTNLEYRLMLLLFQNVDRIVDKYQIVTEVWGEHFLDEVDDARVEKLVSRLRQKIEPNAAEPRFITTVRGRGYRLARGEEVSPAGER
jgi:DNA-binding winged helix-turn-helix (wHTH) protein